MPEAPRWASTDAAFRRSEISAVVGRGEDAWHRAADDVLRWRVKTRSGFQVNTPTPVRAGQGERIRVRVLGVTILEPIEVVTVVEDQDRGPRRPRTSRRSVERTPLPRPPRS